MKLIDILKYVLPFLAIWIALCLSCALWVTRWRRTGERQVAGDPYFFPFGEMPIVPRERHLIVGDFRAWGIPDKRASTGALRGGRNESGGRPNKSASGTAVVLTFPKVWP